MEKMNGKTIHQKPNAWYIFYTFPQSEKKALQNIIEAGFEAYLPLKKEEKVWKNRQRKIIETPLIPGYVFVYTNEKYLFRITTMPKICRDVRCGKIPSTLRESDMILLKKMCNSEEALYVGEPIKTGQQVKVMRGAFAGFTGVVAKKKGKSLFGLHFPDLNQSILAEVNCNDIIPVKEKKQRSSQIKCDV